MMYDTSDWDRLLSDLTPKDPEVCYCPKHSPVPHVVNRGAKWRDGFRCNGWDGLTAVRKLGFTFHCDPYPPATIGDTQADAKYLLDGVRSGALQGLTNIHGKLWVRPDCGTPIRTTAHELAHQVLNHTGATVSDEMPMAIFEALCEVEAECTAMLVDWAITHDPLHLEMSRHYIGRQAPKPVLAAMPQKTKDRIKAAALKILAAGEEDACSSYQDLPLAS